MLKNNVGSLVLVLGVASCVCSCGSGNNTGATSTGGTTSATGGASAAGGSATTGGAVSSRGGIPAAGGATGTSTMTMTLADACARNCFLGAGLDGCSTTYDVCVQSCMTTFVNTSNVNSDLGRQYTEMMVCIATDPYFDLSTGYTCAKADRALNKWSPLVDANLDTPCKQLACDWNCDDATAGNFDPWICIPCHCSSVH